MAEAKVQNIESIEAFCESLGNLRESARRQTDEIREQLQRVSHWLDRELPEFWGNELRIAQIRWTEARDDLRRCESKTRAEDERSCLLQRKNLERATARRNLCEQKTRLIPHLAMQWSQFLQDLALSVRQLEDMSESYLPLAIGRLQLTIEVLKKYAAGN
jgi:hypothetical protein